MPVWRPQGKGSGEAPGGAQRQAGEMVVQARKLFVQVHEMTGSPGGQVSLWLGEVWRKTQRGRRAAVLRGHPEGDLTSRPVTVAESQEDACLREWPWGDGATGSGTRDA